jgi:hypothetical protein
MAEFASYVCVVYLRLRENYAAATNLWQQYRYPNVLPIDKPRITEEETLKLRQQALLERSATENAPSAQEDLRCLQPAGRIARPTGKRRKEKAATPKPTALCQKETYSSQ